jgi:hypothetical protein
MYHCFLLGISLLVLAFYAKSSSICMVCCSFRVMEAITANLGTSIERIIMVLVTLSASVLHINRMFPWMAEGVFDPTSP